MNNDTHWLERFYRQSSSSYGREAGFSVTRGITRITPFGAVVALAGLCGMVCVIAMVVLNVPA